ncbi:hypothetical protein ES707_10780 [subsurface metagenome]
MAARTIGPKKFAMRILVAMTGRAIQGALLRRSKRGAEELGHVSKHLPCHPGMTSPSNRDMRSYSLQRSVIHFDRTLAAFVLAMATATILNGGVEDGRLLCKVCRRTGMALDTCRCFDPTRGRVAAFAFAIQEGVCG